MIEKNLIGRKGGGGFYRVSKIDEVKTKEVINFSNLSYKVIEDYKVEYNSINELLNDSGIYGRFFQDILLEFYLYITSLIPSVTDNIYDIDKAMRLGYSWKTGPFELLLNLPNDFNWVRNQAAIRQRPLTEYLINNSDKTIDVNKFHTSRINLQETISLLDNIYGKLFLYQDRLVFSINSKMNTLNEDVFNLLLEAVDVAEERGQDLYIIPLIDHLSAGADLKFMSHCIENKDFTKLKQFLRLGQKVMMRLKYSKVNIISCAMGVALGGGCEILLHSDFIVANQELNAGLVEVSVGLIPGLGGIKEMICRVSGNR